MYTFPVESPPSVRFCAPVVCSSPSAPRNAPCAAPPDNVAVGTPESIFNTANLALVVAAPHRNRSTVWLIGYSVPSVSLYVQ